MNLYFCVGYILTGRETYPNELFLFSILQVKVGRQHSPSVDLTSPHSPARRKGSVPYRGLCCLDPGWGGAGANRRPG